MPRTVVWQHSSNSNIKIVSNSIEHFLWNPSDFFFWWCPLLSADCFHKLCLSGTPTENSQTGWDLGNRMARGYQFDAKLVCPIGSYACDIQVFCLRNEVAHHFSNRTLEYVRHIFPWDRLISRQTDNPWSCYSQDLNPSDYFLRRYLKNRVRENNPQTREDFIRKRNQTDSTGNAQ